MPSYVLGAKQGYAVNKVGKTSVLQELTLFGGGREPGRTEDKQTKEGGKNQRKNIIQR